jgi:hypothetical protein
VLEFEDNPPPLTPLLVKLLPVCEQIDSERDGDLSSIDCSRFGQISSKRVTVPPVAEIKFDTLLRDNDFFTRNACPAKLLELADSSTDNESSSTIKPTLILPMLLHAKFPELSTLALSPPSTKLLRADSLLSTEDKAVSDKGTANIVAKLPALRGFVIHFVLMLLLANTLAGEPEFEME